MKYFAWFSGAILGFSGVILGAIGAHALERKLQFDFVQESLPAPETLSDQHFTSFDVLMLKHEADAQERKQKRMSNWDTASRYQLFHALFLLVAGLLATLKTSRWLAASAAAAAAGVLIFSGSLYLYAFTGNTSFAMVTPAGGVALISAWVLLFIHLLITRKNS